MNSKFHSLLYRWLIALIVILFLLGLSTLSVPYYVMQPGEALDVRPTVHVQNPPVEPKNKGGFFLTTVSVRKAMVWDYLHQLISKRMELVPEKQMILQGESDEDYQRRQKANMEQSQHQAIIAAFKEAKRPLQVRYQGVQIVGFAKQPLPGLQIGDLIQRVDQRPVRTSSQLIEYLQKKRPRQSVQLTVKRGSQQLIKTVPLLPLNAHRVGIGIIPMDRMQVRTEPRVQFQTGNIGGPSAGLMFALEICNRLFLQDLTQGQKIAGTGTIDADGRVGQIGGIRYKVIAAAEQGASIFLCPRDLHKEDRNEQTAKETVKQFHLPLRVVPVSHLHEAIVYLTQHSLQTAKGQPVDEPLVA